MNKPEAKHVLRTAFTCFNEEEKENIRCHLDSGTKVACGETAHRFAIDGGL